jgi:hypothetical protein
MAKPIFGAVAGSKKQRVRIFGSGFLALPVYDSAARQARRATT